MESLRERQTELISILEAINGVLKSEDWKVLESLLWSKRVSKLEKDILNEAKKKELNLAELKYLNGRRDEAKKYADLKEFAETLIKELEAIKIQIK